MNRFLLGVLACTCLSFLSVAHAQEKPNIVLVFLDNFGWGEPGFNGGGIIRGSPTPRLDSLAEEGLRLTNFKIGRVEHGQGRVVFFRPLHPNL